MYEIGFKEGDYTGEYGPLMFVDGVAKTENIWFAAWAEGKGFGVMENMAEGDLNGMALQELKTLCVEKGFVFNEKMKKRDLISVIEGGVSSTL